MRHFVSCLSLLPTSHYFCSESTLSSFSILIFTFDTHPTNTQPTDRRGNRVLIGICAYNILAYPLIKVYYDSVNKKREKVWSTMSVAEQIEYRDTTKDQGSMRLDFRFAT